VSTFRGNSLIGPLRRLRLRGWGREAKVEVKVEVKVKREERGKRREARTWEYEVSSDNEQLRIKGEELRMED
jgi:hypothetical protein